MIEPRTKILVPQVPARFNDREYRELTLVAPKVGWRLRAERNLRGGEHPEALSKYYAELIARCAGVEIGVVEDLYEQDIAMAMAFIVSFQNEQFEPVDPDETTHLVEFPEITVDNRAYSSLVIGKTKLGWRRQAEGHLRSGRHPEALTNFAVALIAKSASVDQKIVLALDDDVFFTAWGFVQSFLPGGPGITTA